MEPCLPGYGWTSACSWEAVNKFLVLLCLPAQLLLYLLNCPYSNPWVFSLLLWFSPPFYCGEWVSSSVGLRCQLGLNHDSWSYSAFLLGTATVEPFTRENIFQRTFQFWSIIWHTVVYICFSSKTVDVIIVFHTTHRDKNSLNVGTAQVFQMLTHNYMTCFSQYEAENMSTWKYIILNFLFQ